MVDVRLLEGGEIFIWISPNNDIAGMVAKKEMVSLVC
jgi:hypothetical protein